jgi:hypothetical protein
MEGDNSQLAVTRFILEILRMPPTPCHMYQIQNIYTIYSTPDFTISSSAGCSSARQEALNQEAEKFKTCQCCL